MQPRDVFSFYTDSLVGGLRVNAAMFKSLVKQPLENGSKFYAV